LGGNWINMAGENIHSKDELRDTDPQLVRMIKFALSPSEDVDVPASMEKIVMDSYRKHNRYQILKRKIRIKIGELKKRLFG